MEETKDVRFIIPFMNKDVVVKVTVYNNLMGKLIITIQIGDEPPLTRITDVHNPKIVK